MANESKVETIAAPMSFTGSLARTLNWFWNGKELWFKLSFGWLAVAVVVMMWWTMIFCWYMIFGILLVPYRLVRRGARKQKIEERRHREMLNALKGREGN